MKKKIFIIICPIVAISLLLLFIFLPMKNKGNVLDLSDKISYSVMKIDDSVLKTNKVGSKVFYSKLVDDTFTVNRIDQNSKKTKILQRTGITDLKNIKFSPNGNAIAFTALVSTEREGVEPVEKTFIYREGSLLKEIGKEISSMDFLTEDRLIVYYSSEESEEIPYFASISLKPPYEEEKIAEYEGDTVSLKTIDDRVIFIHSDEGYYSKGIQELSLIKKTTSFINKDTSYIFIGKSLNGNILVMKNSGSENEYIPSTSLFNLSSKEGKSIDNGEEKNFDLWREKAFYFSSLTDSELSSTMSNKCLSAYDGGNARKLICPQSDDFLNPSSPAVLSENEMYYLKDKELIHLKTEKSLF